ncbi:MAG: hypothetical protein ABSB89_09055 [Candidatus Bathyarchaeia archaeon]|jgi:hypothetical protein
MLVKEGRNITVPIIFYRENADSHGRRTRIFLETSVNIKCWNEDDYVNWTVKLLKGHTGRMIKLAPDKPQTPERCLKIYVCRIDKEGEGCTEQISIGSKYDGLSIKISEDEKVISSKEAFEKISSASCLFLTEDFALPWIEN